MVPNCKTTGGKSVGAAVQGFLSFMIKCALNLTGFRMMRNCNVP